MRKRLNVRVLLILLAVVLLAIFTVHLAHGYQMQRYARLLVSRAEAAAAAGENDHAATLLGRSLVFVPDDPENLVRYGEALEYLSAALPRLRTRALAAYQDALARAPGRKDLRERIAFLAFDLGQLAETRKQLTILLDATPERGNLIALLARCDAADGAPARAAKAYEQALALLPTQVELYVQLAELYRDRLEQLDAAADVLDRMVRANPESDKAYLARARFRAAAGATQEAAQDLARAEELAPESVDVLLASADLARRTGQVDKACSALRKGLAEHPDNTTLYLRLAELERKAGRRDEALRALEQGLQHEPHHPGLLQALGEALLAEGKLPEAETIRDRLRDAGRSPLAADYLQGRAYLFQQEWLKAARLLETVTSAGQEDAVLAAQTRLALGEAYGHLGYPDLQLRVFEQALGLDASSTAARLSLADVLLKAGRVEEAIEHYRRLVRLPDAPLRSRTQLVRALVRLNIYLPPRRRDWKEITRLLQDIEHDTEGAATAALLRAEVATARGQPGEARKVLEQAQRDHPEDTDLSLALADLAAGGGDFDEAVRLLHLSVAKTGQLLQERVSRLDAWAQRGSRAAERSLEELAENLDRFTEQDQVALVRHLARLYRQTDRQREWLRLCRQLASKPLQDLAAAQQLLEVVLLTGDPELITPVVNQLRALEGEGGTAWRYGAAAVLVAYARRGEMQALTPARGWLDIVKRVRPGWPRPELLRGQIEEMDGQADRAVEHYLRAFDLGDRQPGAVFRLIQLLSQRRRFHDADRIIRHYQEQAVLGRDLARQAAEIALQAGNFDHALELADEVVPAGNTDFRDQLWLGQLLARRAKRQEAERALYRATELGPGVPDTWVALVSYLAQTGQTTRAQDVLAILADKLTPEQLPLARARCWLALSRTDKAEEEYRAALAARPQDVRVLLAAVGFYVHLGEHAKAEPLLRRLLRPGVLVAEEDIPALRRQLALVLSESGEEHQLQEALTLLVQNPPTEAAADQRARLLVLAARPDHRQDALAKLAALGNVSQWPPEERYRLARLYEAENDWPHTRTLMLELLDTDGSNPTYLSFFLEGLLRQHQADEAGPWLTRLEKVAPNAAQTKALRAKLQALGG